jgi:hypothetical protein
MNRRSNLVLLREILVTQPAGTERAGAMAIGEHAVTPVQGRLHQLSIRSAQVDRINQTRRHEVFER